MSDSGKIYSTKNIGRGKYHQEIKQRINSDGYSVITAGTNKNRRQVGVHRLIALAFIPNPDNLPEVDHIDNNRLNNHVSNLQWISHSDNVKKIPFEVGSQARRGENNGRAKVTEKEVISIRKLFDENKFNISQLSRIFNIPWTTISHIVKRETWKHIS